jgi:hypothetical protein
VRFAAMFSPSASLSPAKEGSDALSLEAGDLCGAWSLLSVLNFLVCFGFEIAVGVAPVSLSDPIFGACSPFPLYLFCRPVFIQY